MQKGTRQTGKQVCGRGGRGGRSSSLKSQALDEEINRPAAEAATSVLPSADTAVPPNKEEILTLVAFQVSPPSVVSRGATSTLRVSGFRA